MNKSEFNRLLDKYLNGELSEAEKAKLELWLDAFSKEDKERALWSEAEEVKLLGKINKQIDTDVNSEKLQTNTRFLSVRMWLKIAAILLLPGLVIYYTAKETLKNELVYSSPSGTIQKVILSDGTLAWLKGNSRLKYPEKFIKPERYVELEGEALFEVAKNPQHPFVIRCNDITTKVLGTSFNIKSSQDGIEIIVLTGKVSVSADYDNKELIVLHDEKAIYKRGQHLVKETAKENEVLVATKETDYNMHFNDTRIDEIIKRIERKFSVTIKVENAALHNCLITADFTDQSLETTLRLIAQVLHFEYEIKGDVVNIRGGSCQ